VLGLIFTDGKIALRGDATRMAFTRAGLALEDITGPILTAQTGRPMVVSFEEKPLSYQGPLNEFDAYAPGMMIFAILLIIPQTAMILGRELRWGTYRRLRLTPLKNAELLAGVGLSQLVIGALQIAVLFLAALALGFHNRGSLLLAIVLGLFLSLSAIGIGLVVSGFAHKDSDALNTGGVFSMLQVFLSGAFFPMPSHELFRVGGHSIGVFDFIPATHGMMALEQVLVSGAGWTQIAFRAWVMLVLSLIYLGLGVWIFGKIQRKRP
jgi:ABC-2 type transport system permease protein